MDRLGRDFGQLFAIDHEELMAELVHLHEARLLDEREATIASDESSGIRAVAATTVLYLRSIRALSPTSVPPLSRMKPPVRDYESILEDPSGFGFDMGASLGWEYLLAVPDALLYALGTAQSTWNERPTR